MRQNRDFHRQVRVVYRACRRLYGKERTQDECLRVFKVVFPELYRLRNSTDEFVDVPRKISDGILKVTHDWNPHGALSGVISHAIGKLQRSLDWKREELMQFYEDIMPVVMRIRKLTPRECYRLQGVNEEKINVLLRSGISKSAHYKLAGNSITSGGNHKDAEGNWDGPLFNIFRKLLIEKNEEYVKGQNVQLSLF